MTEALKAPQTVAEAVAAAEEERKATALKRAIETLASKSRYAINNADEQRRFAEGATIKADRYEAWNAKVLAMTTDDLSDDDKVEVARAVYSAIEYDYARDREMLVSNYDYAIGTKYADFLGL